MKGLLHTRHYRQQEEKNFTITALQARNPH